MNDSGSSSGSGLTRHFAHSGYELSFLEFLPMVFVCERMRLSNDDFILFLCVNRIKGCSRSCEEGAHGFRGLWNLNSMVNNAV